MLLCCLIKNIENQVRYSENKVAFEYISAPAPTENPVSAYVTTDYPISDSNVTSRKKGGQPKGVTDENKRGTKISISNAN